MKTNKKPKLKGNKLSAGQLKKEMIKLFSANKSKRYNAKQVAKKLKIANSKDSVAHAIKELESQGLLYNIKDDKFKWDTKASVDSQSSYVPNKVITGIVDMTRSGAAYIISDDIDDDVYVQPKHINGAMNKDVVKVSVPQLKGKRRPEGRVVEVVNRAVTHVLGKLRIGHNYGVVYPIRDRDIAEVFVNKRDLKGAEDGNYVVAKLTDFGQAQNKGIWGKITTPLVEASDNDLAMQSILLAQGFDLEFPPEVIEQVKDIQPGVDEKEVAKRRDFREILTFTIDPDTAKDFDDAISLNVLENGNTEIGVHIADVTHYLPENTPLDKEALNRSTSVYLVDRVLPMLPEKLSNDLCSLNPHEDRYTFSAVFTFDQKYKVVDEWFGKTVIHSDRRFTYEEAQERIETGEGDLAAEIRKLNEIAYKLRKLKYKNGAISFESEEVKFILDDDGKPTGVYTKERKDAHMLIEDYMLLANKSVAKYIAKKSKVEIPLVYRIHDEPNPDKLADFAVLAKSLGYQMDLNTPMKIAKSFNGLYAATKENEQLKMLEPLAIRTMSKAEYSTENIGHYGLGFEYYAHFTSPIRRYADVLVHRILFKNLTDKDYRVNKSDLEAKSKHISLQERKATDAERESIKYKQVEFIMEHIGEEFAGKINGMIDRGIFVELNDSKVEGMVSFDRFDESFEVAENRFKAVGSRTGRELNMGQLVRVKILDADLDSRQIEMDIVEDKASKS